MAGRLLPGRELVGVTGHQDMPQAAVALLGAMLPVWVPEARIVTVVCSLAKGADTLVAEHLLARGADLHVVIPCRRYEETFTDAGDQARFRRLLDSATSSESLDFEEPSEEAFLAGGLRVLDRCDWLLAVWDGLPAKGLGGTGDIVDDAARRGRPVRVLWPPEIPR